MIAGGAVFQKWLPGGRLTLGELEAAAGAGLTVFLPLDPTGVAREEVVLAKRRLDGRVITLQGPGDAEQDGFGLAGDAAAFSVDVDV